MKEFSRQYGTSSKPEVVTLRDRIRSVGVRWKMAYLDTSRREPKVWSPPEKEEIYYRLLNLDLETCSADDVNQVTGNDTWIVMHCDGCDKLGHTALVRVGDLSPDYYEPNTASLCRECVEDALRAFSSEKSKDGGVEK